MDRRGTYVDGTCIHFDSDDWEGMRELMSRHAEFETAYFGKTESGGTVMISVNKDNITVETFLDNGYVTTDIYYEDGTVESIVDY